MTAAAQDGEDCGDRVVAACLGACISGGLMSSAAVVRGDDEVGSDG